MSERVCENCKEIRFNVTYTGWKGTVHTCVSCGVQVWEKSDDYKMWEEERKNEISQDA